MIDPKTLSTLLANGYAAMHTAMEHARTATGMRRLDARVGVRPLAWDTDNTPLSPQTPHAMLALPDHGTAHQRIQQAHSRAPLERKLYQAGMAFITAAHAHLPLFQGPQGILCWQWDVSACPKVLHYSTLNINGCSCDPKAFADPEGSPPFTGFVGALMELSTLQPATTRYMVNATPIAAHSPHEAIAIYTTIGSGRFDPSQAINVRTS